MTTTFSLTHAFDVGFERAAAARTSEDGSCERLVVNVDKEWVGHETPQSREALRDVHLHLAGALHVKLCLTSVAVKRRSLGLLVEAANPEVLWS